MDWPYRICLWQTYGSNQLNGSVDVITEMSPSICHVFGNGRGDSKNHGNREETRPRSSGICFKRMDWLKNNRLLANELSYNRLYLFYQ